MEPKAIPDLPLINDWTDRARIWHFLATFKLKPPTSEPTSGKQKSHKLEFSFAESEACYSIFNFQGFFGRAEAALEVEQIFFQHFGIFPFDVKTE